MKEYAKAIGALLAGISTWGITAGVDGTIDLVEIFGLIGVVGTVFVVWAVPNDPSS